MIVDYLGRQYIVELKIGRGPRDNAEGEKQIGGYPDCFGLSTGYMLSFNFNRNKEPGVRPVRIGDKLLYQGTATAKSDVDLMVDSGLKGLRFVGLIKDIKESLYGKDVDVFDITHIDTGSLVDREIQNTGVEIYAK